LSSGIEHMTVKDLADLDAVNPRLALNGRQILTNGAPYEDFVKVLYETLDSCIRTIEEDPKVRQGDGEDRLSSEIIAMLRSAGYDANHDVLIGGHSDIVVKSLKGDCWVGEAKVHSSYPYLLGGWNQLTTRYLRGTPGYDRGGLLVYIRNKDSKKVVETWKANLQALQLDGLTTSDCPVRKEFGFYSSHVHQSGSTVNVRHFGINLWWDPTK
jgi:hypothetical protein